MDNSILSDLSLKDKSSAENALNTLLKEKSILLSDLQRFDSMEMENSSSSSTIVLCLFQGLDQSSSQYPGYVKDTGVTVDGQNILPGGHSVTVLQPQIKCYATRVKCSAHIKDASGREYDIHWNDAVVSDPENEYIETAYFRLVNATSLRISSLVGYTVAKRPKN